MATFVALYTRPEDTDGFERRYREVHVPLVERWPHVTSWSLTRITGTPRGGEPPYYLLFQADFPDDEALAEALRSAEMREAGRDAMDMCREFGVQAQMLLGTHLS